LRLTVAVTENSGNCCPTPNILLLLRWFQKSFVGFVLLGGAILAKPENVNRNALQSKASGELMLEPHGLEFRFIQVADRLASDTHHVVVWPEVRLNPQRTVMKTDFLEDSAVQKDPNILVNRGQRDRR